ncbi:MAG: hypothetical protein ACPG6B_02250, partial [Oceanihabitans sp.]
MKTIYKINKTQINTLSNNLLKLFILSVLLINFSCSKDDCEFTGNNNPSTCIPFGENTEYAGFTVTTNYSNDLNSSIGTIYNTQLNSQAPQGDDWGTTSLGPQVSSISPANWTRNDIGQVFGIAIDNNENVYLASSDIYSFGGFSVSNTKPSEIYKCSAPSFLATPFITLPNTGGPGNGIGNIAVDKVNNQMFATNLEDGKIYRIDLTLNIIIDTYDPWIGDDSAGGIERQEERVWGIGVNYESGKVKVYFPRVNLITPERSIYSITLKNDGSFPASGSEVIEVSNVPGNQDIISDIAFSSSKNQMLIAERNAYHNSKVMSFNKSGSWNFNVQYFVGGSAGADGENSAGGVDFYTNELDEDISAVCNESFWATGNWMFTRTPNLSLVYG